MDPLTLALLLFIPVVVLGSLAGLVFLARYLEGQARQELKQLGAGLRRLRSERLALEAETRGYADDEPEPFGQRLAALRQALQEIAADAAALETRRVSLNERASQLSANPWRSMLGAPYLWYYLRRDIGDALADAGLLQQAMELANDLRLALLRASLDVAQQARETVQIQNQLDALLNELDGQHLHGPALQTAAGQHRQWIASLQPLPEVFLTGSAEEILALPDRQSAAEAHALVTAARPELERLLAQARDWQAQRQQAVDRVAQMRRLLDEAQQAASACPPEIQIKAEREQLEQLEVIARALQDTLARLEVENIPEVIQQAENTAAAARQTGEALQTARRDLATLEAVRSELSAGFRELSLQMATFGSRATHPVQWKESTELLTALSKQGGDIGPTRKTRTPAQLGKDLAEAQTVAARQKELTRTVKAIGEASDALVELLGSQEFDNLGEWLDAALETAANAGEYAAENWTRGDAVETLLAEVQALEVQAERLVLDEPAEAIPETGMLQRLADTRSLLASYQKLRRRVAGIAQRLGDLHTSESQAVEQMDASLNTLTQVGHIIRSNPYLTGVAGSESEKLASELRSARKTLEERQSGAVEKKVTQASKLANRLEQNANHWLDQLNRDLAETLKELSAQVAKLDEIAPLEDPPVVEARRLLSAGPMYAAGGYESKARFRLDDLTGEFKRRSDYWQSLNAAQNAVQDATGPLRERYDDAAYQRSKAREAMNDAATFTGKKRLWPPTNITLDAERREMESLENQWQGLKASPVRAINLLARVDDLAARFSALAERTVVNVERGRKEQSDVAEMESEIHDMLAAWQRLDMAYGGEYETAHEEIGSLVESASADLEQLQKKYNQGALYYNQVYEKLRAIHRRVKVFQATLDDSHALDINGKSIGMRQSTYRDNF